MQITIIFWSFACLQIEYNFLHIYGGKKNLEQNLLFQQTCNFFYYIEMHNLFWIVRPFVCFNFFLHILYRVIKKCLILGNCPIWRTNSFQFIYLFIVLYMFRACHAHHQEKQIVSIQLLVIVTPCWWPCRVLVFLPEFTPNQHTTRPPTRSDNYQKLNWYNLFSPDEHDMLETCREL